MPNMNQYLTEDFSKNLSIDIGAKHSFKNYKKITEWYEKEVKYYQEIGNPGNIINTFTQLIKNQIHHKVSLNRNDNFTIEDLLLELKNHFESTYKTQGLIASNSKEGK